MTGAQDKQRWGFKAICTDNAGNSSADPGAAQVSTTISTYPMAQLNNITPNLVQSTATDKENLVLGWSGLTSPSVPITGFSVYARHTTGAQWGSWKKWKDVASNPSNSYSEKFPFTTEDPANPNGLWDFQVVAHNAQGDPPFDNSKAQASAVVDLQDKGQGSYMPDMAKR
ncbi:MAG: fibronectin type III domain-containing protein [Anaerolineales bacterium]|nr:fibronectin type III domain-containing protein [Anaerolineales bacterium]